MEVPVHVSLEVSVVEIFLIDPERQERDDESLEENNDLRKTGNSLPDRYIVLFAARNPTRPREAQADPQANLEPIQPFGQTVSGEREDKILTALRKVISAKSGSRHQNPAYPILDK